MNTVIFGFFLVEQNGIQYVVWVYLYVVIYTHWATSSYHYVYLANPDSQSLVALPLSYTETAHTDSALLALSVQMIPIIFLSYYRPLRSITLCHNLTDASTCNL